MEDIVASLRIRGGFHLSGGEGSFERERDGKSMAIDEILMYFD